MQRTEQAQTNTYTPTPCFSVYLDPNWTRAKSSSSSESSSLLPWDMSDRAWNRNDKGLSRWGKRQEGVEGRNDSEDGMHAKRLGGYEKNISGLFLKVPRGQRWWDAGGLHAWSLLLVLLLFLKNSLVPFCLQLHLTVRVFFQSVNWPNYYNQSEKYQSREVQATSLFT